VRKHFVAIADADVSRNRRAGAPGAARNGRRCSRSCADGTRAKTTATRSMTPSGTEALRRARARAPSWRQISADRASELERARMENTHARVFSAFFQSKVSNEQDVDSWTRWPTAYAAACSQLDAHQLQRLELARAVRKRR
jgi:hypothetical protein